MKKLTAEDAETRSPDVVAENVEQLKTIFPEAFTEEKVDFEVLKQLLGGVVEEREEKYGLNWYGKRRARQLALTPSTGTLRPCPEESVDWDTTKNLMIEGDNLEVLKLLQKSYSGKVKLIYIDPPYNTGKDFVYPDDFRDNIKNYLELTGQTDGEGRKISSNTEASGRFHTGGTHTFFVFYAMRFSVKKTILELWFGRGQRTTILPRLLSSMSTCSAIAFQENCRHRGRTMQTKVRSSCLKPSKICVTKGLHCQSRIYKSEFENSLRRIEVPSPRSHIMTEWIKTEYTREAGKCITQSLGDTSTMSIIQRRRKCASPR